MSKHDYFLKHKFISDTNKGLWEDKLYNKERLEKTEESKLELIWVVSHKELTKGQFLRKRETLEKEIRRLTCLGHPE